MSGQDIAKKEADVAKIKDHLLSFVAGLVPSSPGWVSSWMHLPHFSKNTLT